MLLQSSFVSNLQTLFTWSILQLTFARYYLPLYIPEAEKAIYLDDDIIVQGKILHQKGRVSLHIKHTVLFFHAAFNILGK